MPTMSPLPPATSGGQSSTATDRTRRKAVRSPKLVGCCNSPSSSASAPWRSANQVTASVLKLLLCCSVASRVPLSLRAEQSERAAASASWPREFSRTTQPSSLSVASRAGESSGAGGCSGASPARRSCCCCCRCQCEAAASGDSRSRIWLSGSSSSRPPHPSPRRPYFAAGLAAVSQAAAITAGEPAALHVHHHAGLISRRVLRAFYGARSSWSSTLSAIGRSPRSCSQVHRH